jgi:hypothetical protein
MTNIRSRKGDLLVRYAGRRLRITEDWVDVIDDVLETLRRKVPGEIEIQDATGSAPPPPASEPSAPPTPPPASPPEKESKGKGSRRK